MDPREFSGGSDSDPQPQVNTVKVDVVLSLRASPARVAILATHYTLFFFISF